MHRVPAALLPDVVLSYYAKYSNEHAMTPDVLGELVERHAASGLAHPDLVTLLTAMPEVEEEEEEEEEEKERPVYRLKL